jgi:hypothetical protein
VRRNNLLILAWAAALLGSAPVPGSARAQGQQARDVVALVVAPNASPAERSAVEDLAGKLRQLYPRERFELRGDLPASGRAVLVGGISADERVRRYVKSEKLASPESFLVTVVREGPREVAIIAGADPRGAAYGVYAVLEKLGCGFYLSCDALPPPSDSPLRFNDWPVSDEPLVRDRVVFNWHNFLSGCSAWNLADWQRWIVQARKMRFNGVMVHAYGNNPMVRFTFAGLEKPIGYLSTTQRGRDWSTNHVNDVRRLLGGGVFDQPIFGAAAGMAPDQQRGPAAESLMREVFQCARDRGMDVVFAVDVDTASSNPQPLILKLPEADRFAVQGGSYWLANPETPNGYSYYKAQVQALLQAYPQITKLVIWFRRGRTPWMDLKVAEMPQPWQDEYRAAVQQTPEAAKFPQSHNLFALGKIAVAFARALRELGREDIEFCAGTWGFDFLPAADRFLPPKVKLYALDHEVLQSRGGSRLTDAESRSRIRAVAGHRPVVPVAWAHHDDGAYLGRPYMPFEDFHAKLADCRAAGFGIIHWTTRPLDLYFASLARQVWRSGRDQSLRTACEEMAERSFGSGARAAAGEYFARWVTEAPIFGRETSDYFIDRKLENVDQVVAGCRQRLQSLDRLNAAGLTAEQKDRLDYFRGLETFIMDFFRAQDAFQRSQESARQGDFTGARQAISACEPSKVIEQFARFSSKGGITRGEQGLVISLNLRWLAHIVAHRQALGLEPMRYSIAPTSHDPLAQSPGWMTFFLAADRHMWQCLGERELEAPIWTLPPEAKVTLPGGTPRWLSEICRAGVETDRPLSISLGPIFGPRGKPTPLRPGRYRATLLLLDPVSTAPGQRVFEVTVASVEGRTKADSTTKTDRIDIFQETGRRNQVLRRQYDIQVERPGRVTVQLTPIHGKAVLSAATLEPLESP